MQFNLSLFHSVILIALTFMMNPGGAGAASIDFDSLHHGEIANTRFSDAFISADSVGEQPDPSIIFDSRKKGTDFRDAVYGNNTINRIELVTAAELSASIGKAESTKFDRALINSGASAGVENSRFNPVPEPASMLLVGAGLIVLAGIGRKKFFKKKF